MAQLQYEISVLGQASLARSFRGIEKQAAQHAKRLEQRSRRTSGSPYRTSGRDPGEARRHAGALANAKKEKVARTSHWKQIAQVAYTVQRRRHAQAMRDIKTEQAANIRAAKAAQRVAERNRAGMARGIVRSGRNTAGTLVRGAAGAAGMVGGLAIGNALHDQISLEDRAIQLGNQSFRAGGKSRQQIEKEALATATRVGSTGEGANSVLGGMQRFVALTGDFETSKGIAQNATDIATGQGAKVEDVFAVAGETMLALQQRGVKGAEAVKQVNDTLKILAGQGKMGSIEFADLATVMGKLGASTSRFKGNVPELVATMGAIAQISKRGGAVSAEEATTSILRFSDDMVKNQKKFKKQGIDVTEKSKYGKNRVLRDPIAVMEDVMRKTNGDLTKTSKLFGIRGGESSEAMQTIFTQAQEKGGGSVVEGIKVMRAEIEKFKNAKLTDQQVRNDASNRRRGTGFQIKKQMEAFNRQVGTQLLPVVNKAIPAFAALVPHLANAAGALAKFIDWFAKNPGLGIGAIISAAVAKDVAAAAIGKRLETEIASVFRRFSATPPPTMPGGPGTPGGKGVGPSPVAIATTAAVVGGALALNETNGLRKDLGMKGGLKLGFTGDKDDSIMDRALNTFNPLRTAESVAETGVELYRHLTGGPTQADAQAQDEAYQRELAEKEARQQQLKEAKAIQNEPKGATEAAEIAKKGATEAAEIAKKGATEAAAILKKGAETGAPRGRSDIIVNR